MNNFQNKEIYTVCGIQKNYIALIVTVYFESNFYVIFNKRTYFDNIDSKKLTLKFKGKILSNLIKLAEKETNLKIDKISYNLPILDLKIIPHNYHFHFKKPVLFDSKELFKINKKSLEINISKKKYQNFLFKTERYDLPDRKESFLYPPFNQMVSSIKISGYLYKVDWRNIYKYLEIVRYSKIKIEKPLLLPYAINMSISFGKTHNKKIIIYWNETKIQLFIFEKNFFVKHFSIKNNFAKIIKEICKKLSCDENDVTKYLYNLLTLDSKTTINNIDFLVNDKEILFFKIQKNLKNKIEHYIDNIINEVKFIIQEKLNLSEEEINFFIVGDIVKISGLENYLRYKNLKENWSIPSNTFLGLKDFHDTFLIGNAYCRHLEEKIYKNVKKTYVVN